MAKVLALDVGSKRVGVAIGDDKINIAWPLKTLHVNEDINIQINDLLKEHKAEVLVVGLPRNGQGEMTAQTDAVQEFMNELELPANIRMVWQDESLTSVRAESELSGKGKKYSKEDVDALAANFILEAYLQEHA